MKGVFKCAMEDDERRFRSVKHSSLGMPMCTPNTYSRRLKRLSLGMPPCIPFFINNYQFVPHCTIFLPLHALCNKLEPNLLFCVGEIHAKLELELLIGFACSFLL